MNNLNDNSSLVFYSAGDLVRVRHKELNSPIMLVQEKVTRQYKQEDTIVNQFIGLRCRWFDKNDCLQEAVFSTKDLEFYK